MIQSLYRLGSEPMELAPSHSSRLRACGAWLRAYIVIESSNPKIESLNPKIESLNPKIESLNHRLNN